MSSGLTITQADGKVSSSGGKAESGLVINRPDDGTGIISDRALYWNKDKSRVIEEDDPDIAFVFCGPGCEIKREDVAKYGLAFEGNRLRPKGWVESVADTPPLESLTVAELKEVAKGSDVVIPAHARKADIVEAVKKATEPEDLEALTVIELRELAKTEGVALTGITAKADIIAAIELEREANAANHHG